MNAMGFVSVVGLLRSNGQLLLSTYEMLPVTFYDALGIETTDIEAAVRGEVTYRECHQIFSMDDVTIITVH